MAPKFLTVRNPRAARLACWSILAHAPHQPLVALRSVPSAARTTRGYSRISSRRTTSMASLARVTCDRGENRLLLTLHQL